MNMFKKIYILFFITLTTISIHTGMVPPQQSSIHTNTLLYKKNTAHTDFKAAQRLVEESFITPEMQWSILSFLGKSEMVIDRITGQVQDLPSVEIVIDQINQKLGQPMYSAQKESMKNAAHALLEAVDIAKFIASIEAVYQPHNQFASNQLIAQLDKQKDSINAVIKAINNIKTIDQTPSSSYFSWIPYFGSGNSQQIAPLSSQQLQFDPSSQLVAIPASLMPTIIKVNDYKEINDPVQAANLLFKECFIAQQHHLKDAQRIQDLNINLQSPISAQNYIFTQFPNLYNNYSGSYPICQVAQKLVASQAPRYNLQAPVSPAQQQAHQLLLHIRQAIQTALYIANKNSSYNAGSMLKSSIISWLDSIVSELMKYDAQLAQLCKDPLYGATQADIDLESSWSTTAKIASGIVVTAGVVAATVYFNPLGAGTALTQVGSAVYGGAAKASGYASSLVPSAVSNLWGGNPVNKDTGVQGPQLPSANPISSTGLTTDSRFLPTGNRTTDTNSTNVPSENKPVTWGDRAGQAWGIASNLSTGAATLGGVTLMASQAAKQAEQAGYLTPGTYQSATGGYGNAIEKGAITALTVGGTISAINGGVGAWNKWGTETSSNRGGFLPAKFWDTLDLIQTAPGAARAGLSTIGAATALATQGFSTLINQQQINQTRSQQAPAGQQAPQVQQITPQQIYEVLQSNSAQSDDPFGTLVAGIKIVDEQGMADPQTILMILQKIQTDSAANPEFSNKVGQFAQAIAQNLQAQPAA